MFGKKRTPRRAPQQLVLLRSDATVISTCPTADYVLPEPVVLALSVEYFNDPEPCHIHRGAVHQRAMMELLEHCPIGETVLISSLPEQMQSYFPEGAAQVQIVQP